MSSNYRKNKIAAVYRDTTPTMTDQSQADETNVNIIMKKYRVTGLAPGAPKAPMYGDFTTLPYDLRELLEEAHKFPRYMDELPDALKGMALDEILALTPERLAAILTPPDQRANQPTEGPQT